MCPPPMIDFSKYSFSTPLLSAPQPPPLYWLSIGNEAETEAWTRANDLPAPEDPPAVAKALAQQPNSNPTRDRAVSYRSSSS